MMKFKYQSGDGFVMCFCGGISVASAVVLAAVGCGFNNMLLGIGGYTLFMALAVVSFIAAYAVKGRQVDELTAVQDDRQSKLDDIIRVERYYTEIFKEVG
jgi:hypothetical protein